MPAFAGKLLVGDGSAAPLPEPLFANARLTNRVSFGRRSHAETLSLIAGSHVVLLPSCSSRTIRSA